jgi:large subunit ribosomal protein L17
MMRGRQLSRDTEHRKALRRNLCQSLFEHGKVRTTLPKAKEMRAMAERLITLAKDGVAAAGRNDKDGKRLALRARRRVISTLQDRRLVDDNQDFIEEGPTRTIVQKLFNDIAPQFADRAGGYTRIIKLSDYRIGDAASLVLLQLLTEESAPRGSARRSAGLRRKRNERKHQFASKVAKKERGGRQAAGETAAAATETAAPTGDGEATEKSE